MGMFDNVEGLNLQCLKGHTLSGFQTKDFDNTLSTVVFESGKLVSDGRGNLQCRHCGHGCCHMPTMVNTYTNCRECVSKESPYGEWNEFNLHLSSDGTITQVERVER